jgi:branched-chain amino acid transport system substrate-binding protein
VKGDAVLKTLKNERFDTIMGPVSFNASGDVSGLDFEYYRWDGGKYAPWKP